MWFLKIALSCLIFLVLPFNALAIDAPILSNPPNSSNISNSSLNWKAVSNATQYRVIVDDEETVTSPYLKNYYTTKLQYSPKLDPGKYFWKVASKDSSGNWSAWSPVWSFTLSSSPETSNPSTPSNSSNPSTTAFTISNTPERINSDESFKVNVSLSSPNNLNSKFFIKGAFKTPNSTNYFGETKVSDWVKNGSSYSNQLQVTTDSSGNWSGEIEVRPDIEDSGFQGSGEYIFKVAKYSSSGSGPTWSNEQKVFITEVTPSPSPNPPTSSTPSNPPKIKPSLKADFQQSSVAAVATTLPKISSSPEVAGQQVEKSSFNLLIILGLILIGLGLAFCLYLYIRPKLK